MGENLLISDRVLQKLDQQLILPELKYLLKELILIDTERIAQGRQWGRIIPSICTALQVSKNITPFSDAWLLFYSSSIWLDTIQDRDPVEQKIFTSLSQESLYNLALSYYVFATSFLDDLSPEEFNPKSLYNLRHMWNSSILRAASGQQKDILSVNNIADISLDSYQQIAQSKTGSVFALAFGGSAILLSGDILTISALTTAGEIFGTLLQYRDDILDANQQSNNALTLPKALQNICSSNNELLSFWHHIYKSYYIHLQSTLINVKQNARAGIINIFHQTFE